MQVAQSAASLAVRVDRLEEQMRQYNGQIEELNFRVRQLQEQLQRFQEDSEFRFQDLEGGKSLAGLQAIDSQVRQLRSNSNSLVRLRNHWGVCLRPLCRRVMAAILV